LILFFLFSVFFLLIFFYILAIDISPHKHFNRCVCVCVHLFLFFFHSVNRQLIYSCLDIVQSFPFSGPFSVCFCCLFRLIYDVIAAAFKVFVFALSRFTLGIPSFRCNTKVSGSCQVEAISKTLQCCESRAFHIFAQLLHLPQIEGSFSVALV